MAVFVAGIGGAGTAVYLARARTGADPAAMVVAGIPGTRSVALLEQDRQHMIQMDAATKTLNLVGTPKLATRPSVAATPDPAASSPGAPGTPVGTAPPPSPGAPPC